MKIAVIGTGNVGGALALGWARHGHRILLGARDQSSGKVKALAEAHRNISCHSVEEAAEQAAYILIAATPASTKDIAAKLGNVKHKVIIDAMNSIGTKPEPFTNTTTALMEWTNCEHVVKCFNTTGFENMADPIYHGEGIDLFMAGDSAHAKDVAKELALNLGFGACYDFGGSDKFDLLEQFALSWINLAIMQKMGRNIAFQLISR